MGFWATHEHQIYRSSDPRLTFKQLHYQAEASIKSSLPCQIDVRYLPVRRILETCRQLFCQLSAHNRHDIIKHLGPLLVTWCLKEFVPHFEQKLGCKYLSTIRVEDVPIYHGQSHWLEEARKLQVPSVPDESFWTIDDSPKVSREESLC